MLIWNLNHTTISAKREEYRKRKLDRLVKNSLINHSFKASSRKTRASTQVRIFANKRMTLSLSIEIQTSDRSSQEFQSSRETHLLSLWAQVEMPSTTSQITLLTQSTTFKMKSKSVDMTWKTLTLSILDTSSWWIHNTTICLPTNTNMTKMINR